MAGDDRVRHCAQCNLSVYNFAAMTRAEVDELVANREGRLCARLHQRTDETILTSDCVNPFQIQIRKITRVAGIALSAATIGINVAAAQAVTPATPSALVQIQRKETGIVVQINDASGAVIPKAKIQVSDNVSKKQVATGATDETGIWHMSGFLPGDYILSVRSPGFQMVRRTISITPDKITELQITLPVGTVGEVVSMPVDPPVEPEDLNLSSEPLQVRFRETGLNIQIHDESGAGVSKVRISFKDSAGKKYSGTTDKDGAYSFINLKPGEYKLKIHIPKVPGWEQKVTIVRDEMVLVQLTKPVVYVVVGELN